LGWIALPDPRKRAILVAEVIELSENAIREIRRLQEDGAVVRVRVAGGGCSGLSYKLDFERDSPRPEDAVFEKDGVRVVVDPKSHLYLSGMTLDFSGGLNGKGFLFHNPNAKRTCGCGSSFSV